MRFLPELIEIHNGTGIGIGPHVGIIRGCTCRHGVDPVEMGKNESEECHDYKHDNNAVHKSAHGEYSSFSIPSAHFSPRCYLKIVIQSQYILSKALYQRFFNVY